KEERDVPLAELLADREARDAVEIDIDHRAVERVLADKLKPGLDPADRAGDLIAALYHHVADGSRGEIAVLDHEDARSGRRIGDRHSNLLPPTTSQGLRHTESTGLGGRRLAQGCDNRDQPPLVERLGQRRRGGEL